MHKKQTKKAQKTHKITTYKGNTKENQDNQQEQQNEDKKEKQA